MSHLSTRPGFLLVGALSVLLLILPWAAFGVFAAGEEEGHAEAGHPGMGAMAEARSAFYQRTQAFIAQNTRRDGCVTPMAGGAEAEEVHHPEEGDHEPEGESDAAYPVVYLLSMQWTYLPEKICLEAGATYLFRMMAFDVTHGASLQLGPGSRMVRLPPGMEVEEVVAFTEAGEYLLYCSYYCGLGHAQMKGRIIVEASERGGGEHEQHLGHDQG